MDSTGTTLGPSADEMAAQDEALQQRETQRESVRLAAEIGSGRIDGELSAEAQDSATEWFLSDKEIPMTRTLDINVGTPDQRHVIVWTITAIDGDTIKRARKQAEEGGSRAALRRARAAGQAPEVDAQEANARIVVAGSVNPDFRALAKLKMDRQGVSSPPDPDIPAVMMLKYRLGHKPGLIDLIAGEILSLSGYDDDDIQEHAAGKL